MLQHTPPLHRDCARQTRLLRHVVDHDLLDQVRSRDESMLNGLMAIRDLKFKTVVGMHLVSLVTISRGTSSSSCCEPADYLPPARLIQVSVDVALQEPVGNQKPQSTARAVLVCLL